MFNVEKLKTCTISGRLRSARGSKQIPRKCFHQILKQPDRKITATVRPSKMSGPEP